MKVSIIIPVFNSSKTIERCLNSLIYQKTKFYEIIVVDDGSTDNTGEIVKKIIKQNNNQNIILISNTNHGVSFSRNCGVAEATGDYISFIDADDYLDLDALDVISKKMVSEYDFIRYNFKNVGGKSFGNNMYDLKNKKIYLQNNKSIYKHLLTVDEKIPNLVMLLIIKKDIAKQIRFDETLTMMEDVDYYNQLCLISKCCYFLDEKKYNYCVNINSVTHSDKNYEKNIFGIVNANRSIINRCKNIFDSKFIKYINANHARVIGNYLILSKHQTHYLITLKKLLSDSNFNEIIFNCCVHKMSLKDKIMIYLLKFHKITIINLYVSCIHLLKRI